jgi:hypothetical protein
VERVKERERERAVGEEEAKKEEYSVQICSCG